MKTKQMSPKTTRKCSSREVQVKNNKVTKQKQKKLDYLSKMPTEVLQTIFGSLKNEILSLTKVCKRFNEIVGEETKLVIKADKLLKDPALPEIKRSYKRIEIIGAEINPAYLEFMLSSSQYSARSLFIGYLTGKRRSKIHLRTLMQVLRWLPNLEELTIRRVNLGVHVILPKLSYEAIKPEEYPVLTKLKQVDIESASGVLFQILKSFDSIEHLRIADSIFKHNKILSSMIEAQKRLKFLQLPWTTVFGLDKFPELTELVLENHYGNEFVYSYFTNVMLSPKLKKLTLGRRAATQDYVRFLRSNKSQTLERIQINGNVSMQDLEEVLPNYPALITLKRLPLNGTSHET